MAALMRAVLLLALLAAPLVAQENPAVTITMKDDAHVRGGVVRLGDVASVEGAAPAGLADLVLGNAPWPGDGREVSRLLVRARMISAGFSPEAAQFAGADVCAVRADALRIAPARIAAAAEDYVRSLFPEDDAQVSVALEHPVAAAIVAPGSEAPVLSARVPGGGAPMGSVRVIVEIRRGGLLLKSVPVSLNVRVSRTVGVACRLIAAGEPLTAANVAFQRRDVSGLSGAWVDGPRALAGRVADRRIAPGQVVTGRLAPRPKPPIVIKANQRVFLIVQTPTLRVVTLGKAVGSAREGELARARNLTTGREVVGRASAMGVIEVQLGGPNDGG